jgi:hypothetical protein
MSTENEISIKSQVYINGGDLVNANLQRGSEGLINQIVNLPPGNAGVLGTRTDEDTGEATLAEGHGLQSADVVDVFWDGGVRYGMTATVDGNDVAIDGGAGDDLPAAQTAVVVCKQTSIDEDFTGNKVVFSIVMADHGPCHVDFQTAVPASKYALSVAAGEKSEWDAESNAPNPFADATIDSIKVSNGDPLNTSRLQIAVFYDSV